VLGFARTDNEALVSCLGDPQRAVAAYHELLRLARAHPRSQLAPRDPMHPLVTHATREGGCPGDGNYVVVATS